jgi:hypothetical protein
MGESISEFARVELSSHMKKTPNSFITPIAGEIRTLVHMYETQALPHTSDQIADAMFELFSSRPLTPIQGTDDEWVDVGDLSEGMAEPKILYQNKRGHSVFKDSDGRVWYMDGIICVDVQTGERYHTSSGLLPDGKTQHLRTFIKSFPFTPKTFELKTRHVETPKDWWTTYILMYGDLAPIKEYYDLEEPKFEPKKVPN